MVPLTQMESLAPTWAPDHHTYRQKQRLVALALEAVPSEA